MEEFNKARVYITLKDEALVLKPKSKRFLSPPGCVLGGAHGEDLR